MKYIIVDERASEQTKNTLSNYAEIINFPIHHQVYKPISAHPDIFLCQIDKLLIIAPNTNILFLKKIKETAFKLKNHESVYIIGRGLNYPVALEAAIKLQEVPYIHAEGFAGGELKHGPLALISEGVPVIVIVANDETKKDILSNAMEVEARGGLILGISPQNDEVFDLHIQVPDVGNASPIVNLIPIQLLSYYISIAKGQNPDYLRNLAKSVTVK